MFLGKLYKLDGKLKVIVFIFSSLVIHSIYKRVTASRAELRLLIEKRTKGNNPFLKPQLAPGATR